MFLGFFAVEGTTYGKIVGKLGDTFGLLDFTLGAVGFIWERISDMKNEEKKSDLHSQSEKVSKSNADKDLNETTLEFAKQYEKCVNYKIKIKGDGNIVGYIDVKLDDGSQSATGNHNSQSK
ncbi:MAG: hypothetical protein NC099_03345 [Corallococcus sp.]|nr:hypothetical protein [Corallococcus sp.]